MGLAARFPPAWALVAVPALALAGVTALHCGSSSDDAPDEHPAGEAGSSGSSGGDDDSGGVMPPVPACRASATVDAIRACIDGGGAPRACLARSRPAGDPPCDADLDGLDDALEDAMLESYAPVFAFNKTEGDHKTGDSEPIFPTNMKHYVAHSTLYWRVDGDDGTKKVVDSKPTLDGLRSAKFDSGGTTHFANQTKLGEGPSFWLCLNQESGNYPTDALVNSVDESRRLAEGIDLLAVAHPTGKDPKGQYVILEYMLFYAYNQFTLDTHEGDFEGGAVFVDLESGKVAGAYTDRHATSDSVLVVPLEGPGLLPAKDPSGEAPRYDVCSDTNSPDIGGVRFWDFAGKRHHPVIYTAAGGHASYAYPGATKIQGLGCTEATIIRDVHNGNGPKLVPFESAYYSDWGKTKLPVDHGVHVVNLGERDHLVALWSAFAGQWGCTLSMIPKSYPGPWDNERLCRHWLTNDWGPAPPFQRSKATTCMP